MGLIKAFAFFIVALGFANFAQANEEKFVPYCERSPEVRAAIESKLMVPCDQIVDKHNRPQVLLAVASAVFAVEGIDIIIRGRAPRFKPGDFDGPIPIKSVSITFYDHAVWTKEVLPLMPNVETLFLDFRRKVYFEEDSLGSSENLDRIAIRSSHDLVVKKEMFHNLPRLSSVEFIAGALDLIDDHAFSDLPALKTVNVNFAPLRDTSRAAFTGVPEVLNLPVGFGAADDAQNGEW